MRLFVAINLPAEERVRLHQAVSSLRDHDQQVRWVDEATLHITLKFLGDVAEPRLGEVTGALAAAARQVEPFVLRLGGIGAFPAMRRPRVYWMGVEAPPALADLQAAVERQLAPLGFPTEARPFHPHLTLGRARTSGSLTLGAAEPINTAAASVYYTSSITVETVDLMRSHLSPRGARYEAVVRQPLRSGAND